MNYTYMPESDTSEWKWSWRDEYMKWLSAFAWTNGGTLYIGVSDDGYVVGLRDYRKLLEDLPNKFRDKLHISPSVSLCYSSYRGKNIRYPGKVPEQIASKDINRYICGDYIPRNKQEQAKLEKMKSANPVYIDTDGRYYYIKIYVNHYPNLVTYEGVQYTRSGSTLQRLEGPDLERAVMQTSGKKWDSFETEFTMDDLNRNALDAFRKKAVNNSRLSQNAANVSDITLIKNLNLLTPEHRLKRAAVAMFGNPETVAVGAYIKIAYFAPAGTHGMNSANEIIYHDDIHGPLVTQADKAIEVLYAKYFKALISYKGLQRTETYMIPEDVIREVLLNAIMHKNYASGNPIQVRVYDDHISVMNEGFWPFDVLPVKDAYKPDHESYQYNPLLADLFYKTGEVESWGQGFGKISNACQKYDCPLPEITATDRSVKLTCNGCKEYMQLLKETYNSQQPSDVHLSAEHAKAFSRMEEVLSLHLTESEKKRLLPLINYFKVNDFINSTEAADILGKSVATAARYLKRLIELGVINKKGGSKNTVYYLVHTKK